MPQMLQETVYPFWTSATTDCRARGSASDVAKDSPLSGRVQQQTVEQVWECRAMQSFLKCVIEFTVSQSGRMPTSTALGIPCSGPWEEIHLSESVLQKSGSVQCPSCKRQSTLGTMQQTDFEQVRSVVDNAANPGLRIQIAGQTSADFCAGRFKTVTSTVVPVVHANHCSLVPWQCPRFPSALARSNELLLDCRTQRPAMLGQCTVMRQPRAAYKSWAPHKGTFRQRTFLNTPGRQ